MNATHIPTLLSRAATAALVSIQEAIGKKGWQGIKRSHIQVFLVLARDIVKPFRIADELGITRQAIHQTVHELIIMGLLEMRVNSRDRRAKIISLTAEGAKLSFDILDASRCIEQSLEQCHIELLTQLAGAYLLSAEGAVIRWPRLSGDSRETALHSRC